MMQAFVDYNGRCSRMQAPSSRQLSTPTLPGRRGREQHDWHFEHTPNSVWLHRNTLKHATGGGEVIKRHMAMQSKF